MPLFFPPRSPRTRVPGSAGRQRCLSSSYPLPPPAAARCRSERSPAGCACTCARSIYARPVRSSVLRARGPRRLESNLRRLMRCSRRRGKRSCCEREEGRALKLESPSSPCRHVLPPTLGSFNLSLLTPSLFSSHEEDRRALAESGAPDYNGRSLTLFSEQ